MVDTAHFNQHSNNYRLCSHKAIQGYEKINNTGSLNLLTFICLMDQILLNQQLPTAPNRCAAAI